MSEPTAPHSFQQEPIAASGPALSPIDPLGQGARPPEGRWERLKPRVRIIASGLIAVLAVLTASLLAPDVGASSHSTQRVVIWADDASNQERTQGAPQQAVVNGWTTNALLDLVSKQLDNAPAPDHRPPALLMLGVLLLAVHSATTPAARRT